jgi:predicted dehydrogenase
MLALQQIDAVSIGLPNYLHAQVTLAAFQAGKHVLCEKPLATSAEEALAMVDAAKRAAKTLMVCFNYRFREDARWLKQLEGDGRLGRVYYARSGWSRNRGIPRLGGWFTQKALSGGGPLIDLGVHILDLTLWLMGYPKAVAVSGATFAEFGPRDLKTFPGRLSLPLTQAAAPTKVTFDVEDLAAGFIRFENGAALSIETSWASHTRAGKDDYYVTLFGTEGGCELYVPNYADRDTLTYYTEVGGEPVTIKPEVVTHGGGHALAVDHFVNCLRSGRSPEASGEQGLALMQIIDALYESARSGHEVVLKDKG